MDNNDFVFAGEKTKERSLTAKLMQSRKETGSFDVKRDPVLTLVTNTSHKSQSSVSTKILKGPDDDEEEEEYFLANDHFEPPKPTKEDLKQAKELEK